MAMLVPFDRSFIDALEQRFPAVCAAFAALDYKLPPMIYHDSNDDAIPQSLHIGASWSHFAETPNFFMRQIIFEYSLMPYHWPRNSRLYVTRNGQITNSSIHNLNAFSAVDMEDPVNVYLFDPTGTSLVARFEFNKDGAIHVYVTST